MSMLLEWLSVAVLLTLIFATGLYIGSADADCRQHPSHIDGDKHK